MSNPYDRFHQQAVEKYGNRFKYHWDTYTKLRNKMSITDTHSNITFEQIPSNHLKGLPREISNNRKTVKKDPKEAINKLIQWHPDIDFSNSVYIKASEPIEAICSIHGKFTKRYSDFKSNSGCPLCGQQRMINSKLHDEKDIISKLKELFPDHDFSLFEYTGLNNKSILIDPVYGQFEKNVYELLKGYGHPLSKKTRLISQQIFIERVCSIFPEYDFSKTVYKNMHETIEYRCPIHGINTTKPYSILAGHGCKSCSKKSYSQPELDIIEYIKSLGISEKDILHSERPSFMNGQELDIYLPKYNLAIEYNGTIYHHSSISCKSNFYRKTYKDKLYHFNKWKLCFDNGVVLLSVYDFFWNDLRKQDILKSKIKHYLNLDTKIYARKCIIKEISKKDAKLYLEENHLEGFGFQYKNSKYYGMYYNNNLVMVSSLGQYYDQSAKIFKNKLQRICTLKGHTVVGGISKLSKYMINDIGNFTYQITLMTGGSSLFNFKDYTLIKPRYFWVNPNTLEYYYRNSTQKNLLEKNFKESLLPEDTENTYMERLGYLKIYDNGLANINI